MRLARLAVVLALSACRAPGPGPTAAPIPPPVAPAAAAASPRFDGLFYDGARWRFAVRVEQLAWDEGDPAADEHGNVLVVETSEATCAVTEVRTFDQGRASQVECAADTHYRIVELLAGEWVQTADGRWRDSTLPEGDSTDLMPDDRILAAQPTPVSFEEELPRSANDPGGSRSYRLERDGDAWCIHRTYLGGGQSWLCLDDDGPLSGGVESEGGSSLLVTFERMTADDQRVQN
jgi:hypothetical protein